MRQFWMVWCPNRSAPTYRHDTEAAAETEAERLARANPGEHFIVLEAVALRCVDSMQRVDLRKRKVEGDDIPF